MYCTLKSQQHGSIHVHVCTVGRDGHGEMLSIECTCTCMSGGASRIADSEDESEHLSTVVSRTSRADTAMAAVITYLPLKRN